ncbi:MAG: pyruvate, phosphate dikinase, partial [Alphaproteobacteria bacterium]|nr:pyruvate, phosphate dikinase [Alphaproteobacteria bacterium]
MPKGNGAKTRPAPKRPSKRPSKRAAKRSPKWVYGFGAGKAEGRTDMRALLGGKGANLAEMASIGLPVPPGFTVTTEVCTHFDESGGSYPGELEAQVAAALKKVEKIVGAKFGDTANPLLVSVRS